MGFGACSLSTKKTHCKVFYWDISSIVVKTACLALFLAAEGPRRLCAYIARRPEPAPRFTCVKWGFRMCACGHHYYDHKAYKEGPFLLPNVRQPKVSDIKLNALDIHEHAAEQSPNADQPQANSTSSASLEEGKKRKRRRKRWYWPF